MISLRIAFAPLAGLLFGLSLGCTAILGGAGGDGVQRCDNVGNCDDPDDNRFFAQCIKEDNDIPGVCVSSLKEDVSCDGEQIAMDIPNSAFGQAWAAWVKASNYSDGCDNPDNEGKAGCAGPCVDGLAINEATGLCDDTDPNTPDAVPADPDLLGQDLKDQFCRSFFCDESFACRNDICVPCDPDAEVGDGGCGNLYMNGEPSCVYTGASALDSQCAEPNSNRDSVAVGDCPMP